MRDTLLYIYDKSLYAKWSERGDSVVMSDLLDRSAKYTFLHHGETMALNGISITVNKIL